jgi:hypothetical protein
MDAVKNNLQLLIESRHGECRLQLDLWDEKCIIISIASFSEFIIYIRENGPSELLCYYVHEQDLERGKRENKADKYYLLLRRFSGSDFVGVGRVYVREAVQNMQTKRITGRNPVLTFEEARQKTKTQD